MPCKVQPNQECKILVVKIAVTANADEGNIADGISALLTENGICNEESVVLDWQYETAFDKAPTVKAPNDVEEDEIFITSYLPRERFIKSESETLALKRRKAADEFFESSDLGGYIVVATNGWETEGNVLRRTIFITNEANPTGDSIAVSLSIAFCRESDVIFSARLEGDSVGDIELKDTRSNP